MAAQGRVPVYFDATFGAIDVRDAAAAHLNAVDRGRVGERYILSVHNMTLKNGLELIARSSGKNPEAAYRTKHAERDYRHRQILARRPHRPSAHHALLAATQ